MRSRLSFYSPLMPRRRLVSTALFCSIALTCVLTLSACGSGNGRGEKVSDVAHGAAGFSNMALAASKQGKIAVLWGADEALQLEELPATSWHGSKAETVTSVGRWEGTLWVDSESQWSPLAADAALGYDNQERLLAAWVAPLGEGRLGQRWGIKTRLRDRNGKWGSERLIARLPEKLNDSDLSSGVRISSLPGRFVLSWSAAASGPNDDYSIRSSGLSILKGNKWTTPENVGSIFPAQIEPAGRSALALWIQYEDSRLVYASLTPDGRLGKRQVLAPAGGFLATSSSADGVAAAWVQDNATWVSICNGHAWSPPERLARNGGDWSDPVAIAESGKRSAVAWVRPGELVKGASYALAKRGVWGKPTSLAPGEESLADSVSAGALSSGEIVIVGAAWHAWQDKLEIARVPAEGRASFTEIPTPDGTGSGVFASSPRAVAFVWEADPGPEGHSRPELHAWVYRP